MLNLKFTIDFSELYLTQTPQNVLNALDGISYPLGIQRIEGEKSVDYKTRVNKIGSKVGTPTYHEEEVLSVLLDSPVQCFRAQQIDSTSFYKVNVSAKHYLELIKYSFSGTSAYTSETSTYDLLNRDSYKDVSELLDHVTFEHSSGIRFIDGNFNQQRNRNSLPENIFPSQKNYQDGVDLFPSGTGFKLEKYIIPESFVLSTDGLPVDFVLEEVYEKAAITSSNHYYVDYLDGAIYFGTNVSTYDVAVYYKYVDLDYPFKYSKDLSFVNLNDSDVFNRYNSYSILDTSFFGEKYFVDSTTVSTAYNIGFPGLNPELSSLVDALRGEEIIQILV